MSNNTQKGFTLIELSIVLVIIGLLISMFVSYGSAQITATKIITTKQKQQAIKLALISFISRNHRLPCPATANLNQGEAGYGLEATGCTGTVATGVLPWISLGLTSSSASDAYYNRFTYQVSVSATNTTDQTVAGMQGESTMHTASPIALGNAPTGNQSNDCKTTGDPNPCAAVAVIVSHGQNGRGAFAENGNQNALPTGADELENTDNDEAFIIKEFSDTTANVYDDIVLPVTASELLIQLTTNGAIKDVQSSLKEDSNNVTSAVIANAVRFRSGTAGSYSYPIANVLSNLPPEVQADPWGSQYAFNLITPSIDSSTLPNSIVFTLTSNGPDKSASTPSDNVVLTIYVNELQDDFAKTGW